MQPTFVTFFASSKAGRGGTRPSIAAMHPGGASSTLLDGKCTIEEVFAEIEIDKLREGFRKSQDSPGRIPQQLKPLIAASDFPEKLVRTVEKATA